MATASLKEDAAIVESVDTRLRIAGAEMTTKMWELSCFEGKTVEQEG